MEALLEAACIANGGHVYLQSVTPSYITPIGHHWKCLRCPYKPKSGDFIKVYEGTNFVAFEHVP